MNANANFVELDNAGLMTDILFFASAPLSEGFDVGSSTHTNLSNPIANRMKGSAHDNSDVAR